MDLNVHKKALVSPAHGGKRNEDLSPSFLTNYREIKSRKYKDFTWYPTDTSIRSDSGVVGSTNVIT